MDLVFDTVGRGVTTSFVWRGLQASLSVLHSLLLSSRLHEYTIVVLVAVVSSASRSWTSANDRNQDVDDFSRDGSLILSRESASSRER